jgi:oligopeptide transport system permease protein
LRKYGSVKIPSFHLNPEDFLPATEEEKRELVLMRESVNFWQDGARRFRKNAIGMISLSVIILLIVFAFVVPLFYPYDYSTQIRGSENLAPMENSQAETDAMAAGASVFPPSAGNRHAGTRYLARL